VAEQTKPDPNFPTVSFPNPEEPGAMDLLLTLAKKIDADVAIANDPDADRCAVAIPEKGTWKVLSGDELGFLIAWWILEKSKIHNTKITGQMATSIVSSSLVPKMAKANGLRGITTLTGVKWMGHLDELIFGYEEAIGYCTDPAFVRDKDGITTALILVELFTYLDSKNLSPLFVLDSIFEEFGVHLTKQLSYRLASASEAMHVTKTMISNPPKKIGDFEIKKIEDLANAIDGLPPTVGVRLLVEDGRIIIRPSGTEPKLKCYIEVVSKLKDVSESRHFAQEKLDKLAFELDKIVRM
jgi:phosphomannomutase